MACVNAITAAMARALIAFLALFAASGFQPVVAENQTVTAELRARLTALADPKSRVIGGKKIAAPEFLPKLYAALGYKLAWSDSAMVAVLSEAVARSWEDGLVPSDFHADYVKAQAAPGTPAANPVDRDLLLSDALTRLLYQLYFGKVKPNGVDPNWNYARPMLAEDPANVIAAALQAKDVNALIEKARLQHPLYTELKALMQQYTQYQLSGGWPQIAAGPTLKPGQTDARVATVRARLLVTGEYETVADEKADVFDEALSAGVKRFQMSHGIEADGILGPGTVAALNVTAAERTDQIRVNLERARWLLRTTQPDMVVVNVAGYYLHLFLKGEKVWSTRVIVGQSYNKTPIFTEAMKTVVFNPDWTVPRSIVRNEIFNKASVNPGYLAANNYYLTDGSGRPVGDVDFNQYTKETFPYGVVQRPGMRNALGLVKFLFPNKHSVYLHDTPGRQLFDKADRTFSHGCIRVEDPLKLAELILGDRLSWDRKKIDATVATGKLQGIALHVPLPVLLLYWTVDPSPVGGTYFYRDVYGRDARLLKALDAEFQP